MKKYIIFTLLLGFPFGLFASPFGLKMGMTLDEITEACNGKRPAHNENDSYLIEPAKNHPLFKYYVVFVDENIGLYYIKALTDEMHTNNYGTELKAAFNSITDRVSKGYGNPEITDEIAKDSIWKDDGDWLNALRDGARTLCAVWGTKKPINKDNIQYIGISAKYSSFQKGVILIEYQFENYSQIEDEQDSVF